MQNRKGGASNNQPKPERQVSKCQQRDLKTRYSILEKQKHAAYSVKNYDELTKCIVVNFKHGGTEMAMAIKNMEKPTINMPEVPKHTASRVEIFIWETIQII